MKATKSILTVLVLTGAVLGPYLAAAGAAVGVNNASGASNVMSISAVLCGTLTSTGGVPTQARAYWGQTDGGTNFASWNFTGNLGTNSVGPLSLAVTNLTPNRKYFYRFYATNQISQAWASATTNFQTLLSAGPAPVNLGSTAHFAILSYAGVTTAGGGTLNGDVGASPITGTAIDLTAAQVHGTIYAVDAAGPAGSVIDPALLTAAISDLTIAYGDAAGRTPVPSGPFLNPGAGNIGGMNLGPGLYKFDGTASITGFNLTLTGGPDDVWIFQVATDLQVGDYIQVILAGGAQARNVFWQLGSLANIGSYAVFKGTLMAHTAVVMNTGSTLEGRALAATESVTCNLASGSLPMPEAPRFATVSRTATNATTVVLSTTPYFHATVQSSPGLSSTNWTTIATNMPVARLWTNIDYTAIATVTQRFYRAFLTLY